MENVLSDVWSGIKRNIGLEDGVYDNLIQNVAGVGTTFLAGSLFTSFMVGSSMKSNSTSEAYAEARETVNPVLRLTMPRAVKAED